MLHKSVGIPTFDAQASLTDGVVIDWQHTNDFAVNHFQVQCTTTSAEGTD
jgi:hypothetical protein